MSTEKKNDVTKNNETKNINAVNIEDLAKVAGGQAQPFSEEAWASVKDNNKN